MHFKQGVGKILKLNACKNIRNIRSLCAFTLAEVLITLGIIGVVAAMTMPSLVNDHRNKQYVVAFKKLYSNFSNAIIMFKADQGCDGIDISTCIEAMGYGDNNCNAFAEVAKKMKYVKMAPDGANAAGWVADASYNYYGDKVSNGYGMVNRTGIGCFYGLPDGMVLNVDVDTNGFKVFVDTNGRKGPNRMGKDVHTFTVGCGSASADKVAACIASGKDIFPFVHESFPQPIIKGLCTMGSFLDDRCNQDNMFPNVSGGASPSAYILINDKLPDYREISSRVTGFKP